MKIIDFLFHNFWKFIAVIVLILWGMFFGHINSKERRELIKENALFTFEANGFQVIGYQGWEFNFSGACLWYTLQRGVTTYQGCVKKFGNEYHIYHLEAIDAIKGAGYHE